MTKFCGKVKEQLTFILDTLATFFIVLLVMYHACM